MWYRIEFTARTSSLGQVQIVTDLLVDRKHISTTLYRMQDPSYKYSKALTAHNITTIIMKTVNRYAIEALASHVYTCVMYKYIYIHSISIGCTVPLVVDTMKFFLKFYFCSLIALNLLPSLEH